MTASGALVRAGIIVYGNHDVIARNDVHDVYRETCHDYTLGGAGIDVIGPNGYASQPYTVVDSNIIENIGVNLKIGDCHNQVHGIYVATSYNTITNNIVRSAVGYGIHVYHNPNYNTIANNDIDHSGEAGIVVGPDAGSDGGNRHTATYNMVVNNIARDNGQNGTGSAGWGIREYSYEGPANHNSYLNNDLFNNPKDPFTSYDGTDTVSGGISVDPLYVNYAGQDYHLQSGSPAKNSGTATGAPDHDFDQVARPQGAANDIGAYEFH
jgi:parallel beta-helix repeat protein